MIEGSKNLFVRALWAPAAALQENLHKTIVWGDMHTVGDEDVMQMMLLSDGDFISDVN